MEPEEFSAQVVKFRKIVKKGIHEEKVNGYIAELKNSLKINKAKFGKTRGYGELKELKNGLDESFEEIMGERLEEMYRDMKEILSDGGELEEDIAESYLEKMNDVLTNSKDYFKDTGMFIGLTEYRNELQEAMELPNWEVMEEHYRDMKELLRDGGELTEEDAKLHLEQMNDILTTNKDAFGDSQIYIGLTQFRNEIKESLDNM